MADDSITEVGVAVLIAGSLLFVAILVAFITWCLYTNGKCPCGKKPEMRGANYKNRHNNMVSMVGLHPALARESSTDPEDHPTPGSFDTTPGLGPSSVYDELENVTDGRDQKPNEGSGSDSRDGPPVTLLSSFTPKAYRRHLVDSETVSDEKQEAFSSFGSREEHQKVADGVYSLAKDLNTVKSAEQFVGNADEDGGLISEKSGDNPYFVLEDGRDREEDDADSKEKSDIENSEKLESADVKNGLIRDGVFQTVAKMEVVSRLKDDADDSLDPLKTHADAVLSEESVIIKGAKEMVSEGDGARGTYFTLEKAVDSEDQSAQNGDRVKAVNGEGDDRYFGFDGEDIVSCERIQDTPGKAPTNGGNSVFEREVGVPQEAGTSQEEGKDDSEMHDYYELETPK